MNYFSPMNVLDPTIATAEEPIDYAPRPTEVKGLRIGIIDNTKKNAEAVLLRLCDKLKSTYGITSEILLHKPQRAPLTDAQIDELRAKVDFVVAGIGDCGACSSGILLDAIYLEKAKIPAIAIVTEAFDNTSREMAELWGVPKFRFVKVPHPLASLTEQQMDERATELVGKVVSLLKEGQSR
jgi:hypothetical protein